MLAREKINRMLQAPVSYSISLQGLSLTSEDIAAVPIPRHTGKPTPLITMDEAVQDALNGYRLKAGDKAAPGAGKKKEVHTFSSRLHP